MKTLRRYDVRTYLLAAGLLGALACGDSRCDCVTPLAEPMPEAEKIADAVQMRLTPQAFEFIEGNLPDILDIFLADGLTFDVPHIRKEFDLVLFTIVVHICQQGCTLQAEIVDTSLTRQSPNVIALDAHINLSGTLYLTTDAATCDVPIHIRDKPVSAEVLLLVDDRDQLLTFDVRGVSITIAEQDFTLDCSGPLGLIIELLKGVITDMMNDEIGSQLDSALGDQLAKATCLPCDFYSGGCPGGSSCDNDNAWCVEGTCRTKPLGLVGSLDLGELLADFSPGLEAMADLFLAAGQRQGASADPVVVNDGVEIRMLGGLDAQRNPCVPLPDPSEVPPVEPPPRLVFSADNTVPGTADTYMAGIGVADVFLDWFLYKAYLAGLLCLTIDTESTDGLLSSGALAFLLGSLNKLTDGRDTPVRLQLRPQRVPSIEVGAGTFTVDGEGNRVIDEPLLTLLMPEVALDFYVAIADRDVRLATLTQDITLRLGLDFLPDNRVLPVFDENSIVAENVVASNYELLAEDPQALENVVPTLISLALSKLTESIGAIELPPIEGFVLNVRAAQGVQPRPDGETFEYLGLYANLAMAGVQLPFARHTQARVAQIQLPVRSRMSVYAPGGPVYPEVIVEVSADRGARAEYSFRVDGTVWSIFQPGPRLTIRHPLLALRGEHTIEVRARSASDYRTLDAEPVVLSVSIQPLDDGVRYEPPPVLGQPIPREAESDRLGCASATGAGQGFWALVVLGGAWLLRRRRSATKRSARVR